MRSCFKNLLTMTAGTLSLVAMAPDAAAGASSCAEDRCSVGRAPLSLEGKEALRTSIDTGWMPSCDGGVEHCNKGLQVRANIAMSAVATEPNANLFTAALGPSAAIDASWESVGNLALRTGSLNGTDSLLTVKYSLIPQVEVFLDIGPLEQGWAFSAAQLLSVIPGSKFDYVATASAPFAGWAFGGAAVTIPKPTLQSSQLFSVNLADLSGAIGKITNGSLSIHAQTAPTVTYKTTRVIVDGRELRSDAIAQLPFPPGNHDFLEFPATVEAELSATGDIDVLPAATLSNLGDMNFSPPVTITFSSVKVTKHYGPQPQKYIFRDKTVRIPLPNIRRGIEQLTAGEVDMGGEGTVPALTTNTGESRLTVRLTSSDPRFVVPSGPVEIGPKASKQLDIKVRPEAIGALEATITAVTNDPDDREFTFRVSAVGVEPGTAGTGKKPNGGASGEDAVDSGCGCKTASTSSNGGYGALGGLALGLTAWIRRRRRA